MNENETQEEQAQEEEEREELPQQDAFFRAPARFGNVPVETEPKGWDRRRGFEKIYPRVNLPTQIVERVPMGNPDNPKKPKEPNRLIWGDNLHIMRQLPSKSVDLIYIDPPFFSGRVYNVIWGDDNELRSFNDIWEGGLDGYLIWLNVRLYEMKRLLKDTGSIYVHCDWHASHYIKVEMDKIFGYDNFRNEIVWCYRGSNSPTTSRYPSKTDSILFYSKGKSICFDRPYLPYTEKTLAQYNKVDEQGRCYRLHGRRPDGTERRLYLDEAKGLPVLNWWDDILSFGTASNSKERIGYPTQKPEALLERIIKSSCHEGDIVLDLFGGGGTTAAVAQKLGRRFIVADQSRVAVAVTAERLKQDKNLLPDTPDFTIEHWGVYEAGRLRGLPAADFRTFILGAYGAKAAKSDDGADIHGWKARLPVWVGAPDIESQVSARDVLNFANAVRRSPEYEDAHLRDGAMLAWGFSPEAREAAKRLRDRERLNLDFVRLQQIDIDSAGFRQHIVQKSPDYSGFMTFIHPLHVEVGVKSLGGRNFKFDAGDSAVMNPGAEIVNVQWDFNYDGKRFAADPGHLFKREGTGKKRRAVLTATHRFESAGTHRTACRVQDSLGGEGMAVVEVTV